MDVHRLRSISSFALGLLCPFAVLGGLAEAFLRYAPPDDLNMYLGESSQLEGDFVENPVWAVTYRSWEDFQADYEPQLAPHLPLSGHANSRPVWAFFGNSFIQAPGMLGDTVSREVPERRAFYLKRNELLPVRLAQIEMLLEAGLRPERIFVELMPIDTRTLLTHPLDSYSVTSAGALTYQPRIPGGLGRWSVEHSRLALAAWVRFFQDDRTNHYLDAVGDSLRNDLDRMFGHLARTTSDRGIPVTIILIPVYEQTVETAGFAYNDSVIEILIAHGFDILDPRSAFTSHPNPRQLYVPDQHLSDAGNALLLHELLDHLSFDAPQLADRSPEAMSR